MTTLGDVKPGQRFHWLTFSDTQEWTLVRSSRGTGRNAARINVVVETASFPGETFRMTGEDPASPVEIIDGDAEPKAPEVEAAGEPEQVTTCEDCGAGLVRIPGTGWVDVVSGDHGGTYDICPERYDDVNDRQRGHRPRPIALTEDDVEEITLETIRHRWEQGHLVVPVTIAQDGEIIPRPHVRDAWETGDRLVIQYGSGTTSSSTPTTSRIPVLRAGVVEAKALRGIR